MDYYKKYKKYKKKHRLIGSAQSNIIETIKKNSEISKKIVQDNNLDISDEELVALVSFLKINQISKNIIEDIEDFNKGCIIIAEWLNEIYHSNNPKTSIPVICPGDSPAKIIRFLQLSGLIDNSKFIFISFSLSGMVDYYELYNFNYTASKSESENESESDSESESGTELVSKYIYNQIKDYPNLDNLVIIDYIARGCSIYSIIDSIKTRDKNKSLKLNRKLENINREVKHLIKYRNLNMGSDNPLPVPKTNNVINISNYFNTDISYIIEAERYTSRCLPSNTEYKTNIEYNKDEQLNCDLFVYIALLYKINPDRLIQALESNHSKYNENNIMSYFDKILNVTIINNGNIESLSNVFLSDFGFGGPNTIKLLNCSDTFSVPSMNGSININNILDIEFIRGLGQFIYENYNSIYRIEYYDNNHNKQKDYVFYSYESSMSDKLIFIKMSLLTSEYPLNIYEDPENKIHIYPNQLINAELDTELPTKNFYNVENNKIIKIIMTDGRTYIGYLSLNMGWVLYVNIGEFNKEIILINNLIKEVILISDISCKFIDTTFNQYKFRNKWCNVKFINKLDKLHTLRCIFISYTRYNSILTFKLNKDDTYNDHIKIYACQISDLQLNPEVTD